MSLILLKLCHIAKFLHIDKAIIDMYVKLELVAIIDNLNPKGIGNLSRAFVKFHGNAGEASVFCCA